MHPTIWFFYIIIIILGTEVLAYLWHRYGSHSDYIPGLHDTHRIHHMINSQNADDDFVWILLTIVSAEIALGILYLSNVFPILLCIFCIVGLIISTLVFYWNWWIHQAYHYPDHWLNIFDWFQSDKLRHFVHHYNPTHNYGIASHFTDKIMDSWIDPLS